MQISDPPAPGELGGQAGQHGGDDGLLTLGTRLQEGAGGWRDRNATQRDTHRAKLGGDLSQLSRLSQGGEAGNRKTKGRQNEIGWTY
jgi:hypothetical protein